MRKKLGDLTLRELKDLVGDGCDACYFNHSALCDSVLEIEVEIGE